MLVLQLTRNIFNDKMHLSALKFDKLLGRTNYIVLHITLDNKTQQKGKMQYLFSNTRACIDDIVQTNFKGIRLFYGLVFCTCHSV